MDNFGPTGPAGPDLTGHGDPDLELLRFQVRAQWSDVLEHDDFDDDEDFFDAGGNSLLVAEIMAALGAALGTIAVIVRQEIVLAIMGGIFVVEALSVMLQVTWFKYTKKRYGEGRRLLKMAPLHHHFEKSGWKETQVVVRFWIITMLLCLVGLSTLKLR